jgi:hypothetical protein
MTSVPQTKLATGMAINEPMRLNFMTMLIDVNSGRLDLGVASLGVDKAHLVDRTLDS